MPFERFKSIKFGSSYLSLIGNPYALARTSLCEELRRFGLKDVKGAVLDVGCGTMPYRSLFSCASSYHGLEIDRPSSRTNPYVTHWYDGQTFPLKSQVYEAVICSQVLEHSFSPELLIAEIYRVLQPGGRILMTVPFFWPEHEQPYDSQRFTSFGLTRRLEAAGFEEVKLRKTNPGLACLIQLSIEWLESIGRRLPNNGKKIWHVLMALPYSLMNLAGIFYRSLGPVCRCNAKAALYLDLVVEARKP